ncbi:MAG: hypothetical protein QM729_15510 [Solirubrobacterales bacterium]
MDTVQFLGYGDRSVSGSGSDAGPETAAEEPVADRWELDPEPVGAGVEGEDDIPFWSSPTPQGGRGFESPRPP